MSQDSTEKVETMNKLYAYSHLVASRKACRACPGLVNPSACRAGRFDSNELGPWTAWQGNLDAKIVVIGQDWGDESGFADDQGYDVDHNPTCANLMLLLKSIGIEIDSPSIGQRSASRGAIMLTNAVLCLKQGGAQGDVEDSWFTECGRRFTRPLIELVAPRVVVALGQKAFWGTMSAFGLPVSKSATFKTVVEKPEGFALPGGVKLFPVYHCGIKITNMTRRLDQQIEDWKKIGKALA